MKRLAIILTLLAMSVCASYAQKYVPKDTWPYLYEEFQDGAVRTRNGALVTEAKLNVCVADGTLHYIKNDVIMKIDMSTVYTAKIGNDVYVNIFGKMYQVLVEMENGYVLQFSSIDVDKMKEVSIGYGITSASASAMNVNTLTDSSQGLGGNMVDMRFDNAEQQKENGNELAISVTRYIFAAGRLVEASKSSVRDFPGIDRAAADEFIKANKIKWNKPESLSLLVGFVANQFDK